MMRSNHSLPTHVCALVPSPAARPLRFEGDGRHGRPFSGQSLRLAHLVQEAVLRALRARSWDVPDRGIVPDTRVGAPTLTAEGALYGHLLELGPADPGWLDRPSRMPGALTEPLFLTDPAEADIARSRAGQKTLAHALARAIDAYFRP